MLLVWYYRNITEWLWDPCNIKWDGMVHDIITPTKSMWQCNKSSQMWCCYHTTQTCIVLELMSSKQFYSTLFNHGNIKQALRLILHTQISHTINHGGTTWHQKMQIGTNFTSSWIVNPSPMSTTKFMTNQPTANTNDNNKNKARRPEGYMLFGQGEGWGWGWG